MGVWVEGNAGGIEGSYGSGTEEEDFKRHFQS